MKGESKRTRSPNLLLAVWLLAGAGTWPASGAVLNAPADYPTIQAAINAAQNGDTVQVAAGTYYERIGIGSSKDITLLGAGASVTTVDARASETDKGPCLSLTYCGPGTHVEGFTFTGGYGTDYGGGVQIWYCSPTLANNVIKGNIGNGYAGGVLVIGSRHIPTSPILIGNTITENVAIGHGSNGGGVWLWGGSLTMLDNVVSRNRAYYSGGVANDFWGDPFDGGTYVVIGNTFEDNMSDVNSTGCGLSLYTGRPGAGVQVQVEGNTFRNNQGGGARFSDVSGIVENNLFEGNTGFIGVALHLQASEDYGVLTVRNNTLTNNSSLGGGGALAVFGNFARTTISPLIESNLVTRNHSPSSGSDSVSGLFLSGGKFTIKGNTISENDGGAVIKVYGGDAVVRENLISQNSGRVVIKFMPHAPYYPPNYGVLLESNSIVNNSVEGAISCDAASPIISGNEITNSGYGVDCQGSSPIIRSNLISRHKSFGIRLEMIYGDPVPDPQGDVPSEPLIVGNRISGPSTGVGIYCQDTAAQNKASLEADNTIEGCAFYNVLQIWGFQARVINANGTPASGAVVEVFDQAGTKWLTQSTRTDGYLTDPARYPGQFLQEFLVDTAGVRFTRNPYTVVGQLGDYIGSTTHSCNSRYQTAQVVLHPQNTPPVARCKNVTVSAGADCTAATASIDDGSFDPDVGDMITLAQSPSGPYPLGTTTVTLTVTDSHGVSASCSATVTVADTTPPGIIAPAAVVVGTDAGKCEASNVTLGEPVATDNCGGVTIANDAPTVFPKGVTLVTWTATDNAGNTATATHTVTVNDTEDPTIIAPPDVFIASDANDCSLATTVTLGQPTTADNCDVASVVNDHPSATFPLGETIVTWTVTDTSSLTASAVQKVTVLKSVSLPVQPPLSPEPVANKIRRGQVVPHKVGAVDCSGVPRTSGVTVLLKVQGINSADNTVFQDVLEEANGQGNDGTVTSDGIMQLVGDNYQFNLDTSNFNDANTLGSARYYRSTITMIDNATLTVLATVSAILETRD